MNKGTKIRTALRVAFSIYSAFCIWQVSIAELSKQINATWIVPACAIIIVLAGLIVDALTFYLNNDFTQEACEGTGLTRQLKAQKKEGYIGEVFTDTTEEVADEHDNI